MKFLRLLSPLGLVLVIMAGCASISTISIIDQEFMANKDAVWTETINYFSESPLLSPSNIDPDQGHMEIHRMSKANSNDELASHLEQWADCPMEESWIPVQDNMDLYLDIIEVNDEFTQLVVHPVFTRTYRDPSGSTPDVQRCRSTGNLELDLMKYVGDHLAVQTGSVEDAYSKQIVQLNTDH